MDPLGREAPIDVSFTPAVEAIKITSQYFGVEDGDVEIQTNDGGRFTAHVHMLKASSAYFNERFPWHRMKGFPIILHQSSFAVRTLLSLIYPSHEPPKIATLTELIDVLDAAQAWQLAAHTAREWLAARIAAEKHPLRSWALASSYGFRDTEHQAIERYLRAKSDSLDDIPNETELADGRKVLMLIAAKKRALLSARDALSSLDWDCPSCSQKNQFYPPTPCLSKLAPASPSAFDVPDCTPPRASSPAALGILVITSESAFVPDWRRYLVDRATIMNPFRADASSDLAIEVAFMRHPPCSHPNSSFWSTSARQARDDLRVKLEDIILAEVKKLLLVSERCPFIPGTASLILLPI
ncbi:hypothetical protein DL93DRAFT_1236548 [Clavulina sp. PMI_390]|nr:hypothetical protein DL93DRAFT_1236548 [Clavulina sp. PMI_390]